MENIDSLLESTCRTMIKTILACLDNATKGTIYRIGLMPELTAVRITSGSRIQGSEVIEWGLPAKSDYNPPGKSWDQYRDQPGRPLEAMGWCVEKQRSWTADNPLEDERSVRKQLRGEIEDHYHMEPVLVSKASLYGTAADRLCYPLDYLGNPIWHNTNYIVAAVIKIHFEPGSLRQGDSSTRAIRELSRSLGTELLSLYLSDMLYRARKDFARQRLQSCEILAHELRNTLVKLGFVFTAINAQIAIIRESWENLLQTSVPGLEWKGSVLDKLSEELVQKSSSLKSGSELFALSELLLAEQKELARLALSPYQEHDWVRNKIRPKWEKLLSITTIWDRAEINSLLDRLLNSLRTGMEKALVNKVNGFPPEIVEEWSRLAYININSSNLHQIDEVVRLVEYPRLPIAHKEQVLRVLKSLRALVLIIPEVEEKATRILQSLRYGTWAEDIARLTPGLSDTSGCGEYGIALTD